MIKQFFIDKNITIDEDTWALSEFLQWIFRSALIKSKMVRHGANGTTLNSPSKWSDKGRIKRTTWSINTKSYKEAHFATYPTELIECPIDAGCPECGIVLDPFIGSGTTGVVAKKQGKHYVGIELNKEYIEIANNRIEKLNF